MSKQLAEIKPYAPPFYQERAWDLTDFEDWERELLAAIKVGGKHSIEDEITKLMTDSDWATKQPHLNAFVIPEKRYQMDADIIEASEEMLREWRQLRAVDFEPFDPAVTSEMIAELEQVEEEALEDLRYAYLKAENELYDAVQKWFVRFGWVET